MEQNNALKLILLFSIVGILFSGYLTYSSLIVGKCALNEPCPLFFGYPACVYGLIMYLIIFIISLSAIFKALEIVKALKYLSLISFIGVIFALYFVLDEYVFRPCFNCQYPLGFPTCVYGLLMYLIIFLLSCSAMKCDFCCSAMKGGFFCKPQAKK